MEGSGGTIQESGMGTEGFRRGKEVRGEQVMDYVVVAAIAFIAGVSIMSCVSASKMARESFEQFQRGYELGLEDGKRMKGEAKNENDESTGSGR